MAIWSISSSRRAPTKRTDEYSRWLENRMRFVIEIYDKVREMIGTAIPVGIRLSGDEHMPDGIHHEEMKEVVRVLGERGIDYVHLSSGSYEATKYFFPEKDRHDARRGRRFRSGAARPRARHDAVGARPGDGGPSDPGGQDDLISLGRQLLIDAG